MKYLVIITLALLIISCENKGKKAIKEEVQTEEVTESEVKNVPYKGAIKSAKDSSALSMAFILVPGTNIGTMSDPDGIFMINAPEGTKKLAVVMDGFEKATIEVLPEITNEIYLVAKPE